jgi:hypothetical protein
MMGYQPPPQENLFSMNVALENRVRKDHPLRNIKTLIDFDFEPIRKLKRSMAAMAMSLFPLRSL